jgi:integrase
LIEEYKKSSDFKTLDESTKRVRNRLCDRLCRNKGDKPFRLIDRNEILELRDKYSDKPEAANAFIKVLRQVFAYATDRNYIEARDNPTLNVKLLPSKNPNGFHAWTPEEIEKYENRHAIGTKARLALAIMMYGGCARSSDLRLIGKQHLTKDRSRLKYTQYKGRNKNPSHIDLPLIEELRIILDASPLGDLTFLVNEWGNPFSEKGIGNWFKKRCVEAGLPHCSAHGVRKAAAARLAELGCTDLQIMAIGGWTTLKEVQRYTKGARQKVMADKGMARVEADIERTKVSNITQKGGSVRQKNKKNE